MTGSKRIYPPENWLRRAQEAWEAARQIKDPGIRHEIQIIARLYERLADHAGRRISRSKD